MYKFRYKRRLFWRSVKVIGHKFEDASDRMVLYKPDGALYAIPRWGECHLSLGVDWVLYTKKQMEKEAGQNIPLNVGD